MYPSWKERFIQLDKEGWFDERDLKRDLENAKEIAKNFLRLGRPVEEIAMATKLPIETVMAL